MGLSELNLMSINQKGVITEYEYKMRTHHIYNERFITIKKKFGQSTKIISK